MSHVEETIEATLGSNGDLQLMYPSRLPAGPVLVTIRVAATGQPQRGLAVRELAAEQHARGFPGRSAEDLRAEEESRLIEGAERDQELDGQRQDPLASH